VEGIPCHGFFMREREMKKWSNEAKRAYLAGIIDGEAYVGAIRRLPSRKNKLTTPKYSIRVSIYGV
jgi:hypothetical protein